MSIRHVKHTMNRMDYPNNAGVIFVIYS